MRVKIGSDKYDGRCNRQQTSNDQSAENNSHTEETQHGPAPVPTDIRITNDTGNSSNKRIQWSKKEMKEVLWCFMYVEAKTLTEIYRAAYALWRKKNTDFSTNAEIKLLLNRKNYILRIKNITDIEID